MANVRVAVLLVVLFCNLLQLALGQPQTCAISPSGCQCSGTDPTGKAFTLDIGNSFTYPLVVNGTTGSGYNYIFSPCALITCGTVAPNQSDVCQQSSPNPYSQTNVGYGPVWTVNNLSPMRFTVTYMASSGGVIRTTTAYFVENSTATRNYVSAVTAASYYYNNYTYSFTVTVATLFCAPDPTNSGCICRGTNFTLDISKILPYPYILQDRDGAYEYFFSPCAPITCGTSLSTVCQRARDGTVYNIGMVPTWTVNSVSPLNFTVKYSVPGSPRSTVVNYYQNPAAQFNTTTKVAEYPTFTYTFNVTLAPKPTCTPDPVFGGCVCKGPSFTLDISQTFNYPFVIPGVGKTYDYLFSPCTPMPCGGSYARVCQKDVISKQENICGVNAVWTIYSLHPVNFTVNYIVPGSPRQTLVKFEGKEGPLNYTTAVAEYLTNTYNFNVTLSTSPGASLWTKAVNKLSNMFFFKKG